MDEQQPISWQYVVLIGMVAFAVLLIAAAPIPVERPERPIPLGDLELTAHYDDPASGLGLDYPADWQITPLEPGSFMLSNFRSTSGQSAIPTARGQVQILFISTSTEGLPPDSTPEDILTVILTRIGSEETPVISETFDDKPGARTHIVNGGTETELVAIIPSEGTVVLAQASTIEGYWTEVNGFIEEIFDTLTIPGATE